MTRSYEGPVRPRTALKVVELGTPEHEVWRAEQVAKQKTYETKFAERDRYRPAHWGKDAR